MRYATLTVAVAAQRATLTLNRPDVRNAFDDTMIAELTDAFATLGARDDVRAIVLAANGRAFCAGADLNWMKRMAAYTEAENHADARRLAQMLATAYRVPQPVVARVHGDAFAGGVGLVCIADIVVASHGVRFCLSEARIGLAPATIAPYVIRALGEQAARRYFVSAEAFDCATAHRLGLVSEAVEAGQLDATVARIADGLCANGPHAVRACKALVRDVAGRAPDAALLDDTAARIAQLRASDEGREGVAAFLEKRAPRWRDG